MRTRTIIIAFIGAASVAASYFVLAGRGPAATIEPSGPAGDAKLAVVSAPGIVETGSEEIEVGAEVPGKLKAVEVEEGDRVARGQVVAVIENGDIAASVAIARAKVASLRAARVSAAARVEQARTERRRVENGSREEERREAMAAYEQTLPNVENSKREYERRKRLFDNGDISREEFERYRTAYQNAVKQADAVRERYNVVNAPARKDDLARTDAAIRVAEAQVAELDAQIVEAGAAVGEAEARLAKTIVKSPINGVVLRKRLKAGESFSPEQPNGIVTIGDTSRLNVRVDLDETEVARIREGMAAYVTADAYGEKRFVARVARIGQILGRKNFRTERPTERVDTKILEVLLELDCDQKLPVGLRVDAFIAVSDG